MSQAWGVLEYANFDAALRFLVARRSFLAALDSRGQSQLPGVEVVGVGLGAIRSSLKARWANELLSIGTDTTAERLDYSYDKDRSLVEAGTRMVSLYDHSTVDAGARAELSRRRSWGTAFFCASRLQLKVYDRRLVIMEGPVIGEERTALAVTDPRLVTEALQYFRVVRQGATPIELEPVEPEGPNFTERQYQVIRLLYQGLPDGDIADRLGVSLRTVHYEIASITKALGVQSRFAAGARLTELGLVGGGDEPPGDAVGA